MRTTRRALCAVSIAFASMLALSCDNDFGVFSNVQQEIQQKGQDVFQKTAVYSAFRLGSNYYAVTARLVARSTVAGSQWNVVGIGAPVTSSYAARSVVLVAGTTIYALIDAGGSQVVYSSTDGATWSAIATPAPTLASGTTFSLDALFAAGGELYAEGHFFTAGMPGYSSYTLYRLVGASMDNAVSSLSPATDMTIRGVVYDGANYWFASEDKLVSGTLADGSNAVDASAAFTGLSGRSIWGLSYTGGFVYVTTKDGQLYQAGTAAPNAITSIPLTQVAQVPSVSGTEILVGTDTASSDVAAGYYEGNFGAGFSAGADGAVTLNSAIYSTSVSTFPVHAFFFDPAYSDTSGGHNYQGQVFVCVSPGTASVKYFGLYASKWDATTLTWSGWQAE